MSIKVISFVSAGNLFNAALGFLYLSAVATKLSVSDFGIYSVLTGLLILLGRLIDFGTNSVFVASHEDQVVSNSKYFASKFLLFLITLPLSAVALNYFDLLSYTNYLFFILLVIVYSINYSLYPFFQKEQRYFLILLLNTIPALIKGVFALLIFGNFIYITPILAFIIFGISILSDLFLIPFVDKKYFKVNFSYLNFQNGIKLIKESFGGGFSQFIYEGWQSFNNVLTKIIGSFTEIGVFSLANRISTVFSLVSLSIFTVVLPKNAERKRQSLKFDLYEAKILSIFMLIAGCIFVLIADIFVDIIFGAKFRDSVQILNILTFVAVLSSIQNFLESYFYVEHKVKFLIYTNSIKVVSLVIFSALLIGKYSLTGIAISNLISVIFGVSSTIYFIRLLNNR